MRRPEPLVIFPLALALGLVVPCPAGASTRELRGKLPTLEAAAHHSGIHDLTYADRDRLIAWVRYPGYPGFAGGMIPDPARVRGVPALGLSLVYVRTRTGVTVARLEERYRDDLAVTATGWVMARGHRARYPVGTVGDDLVVRVLPELSGLFPENLVYIPSADGVFLAPWDLPRQAYDRVLHRQVLTSGSRVSFLIEGGRPQALDLELLPAEGTDRRLLAVRGAGGAWVVGQAIPFSAPESWGRDRFLHETGPDGPRRLLLALYNEVGAVESRDHPMEPAEPTVVYGVTIFPRFLAGFDGRRGPILRNLGPVP